jgi:signal recognition particle subunit SRP68
MFIHLYQVLKIVKEAQQQHGLRHYDYQRYRSYCSRRLRRLRKTLNFLHGNQRRFQKKEINMSTLEDSKLLLLPLFQAERAWSYAMQLKQESNSEPRKKFHLVNRLRKAIAHSNEMEKFCSDSKFDARSKLEAQVNAKPVE